MTNNDINATSILALYFSFKLMIAYCHHYVYVIKSYIGLGPKLHIIYTTSPNNAC